jgi:class 3 adenylate cyclase/HAMP domain-containing protein
MSFKLKTVLLILSIALIPYIIIMFYIGNLLRDTYNQNVTQEMHTQLSLTTKSIDQYLQTLQNDMQFMAKLDVMNDIYTGDLDRRISTLFEDKKLELKLYGNFYLLDTKGVIIASSDTSKLHKTINFHPFFSFAVHSTFDKNVIGNLVLEFSPKNFTYFFDNTKERVYYIVLDKNKILYKEKSFEDSFSVHSYLSKKQNVKIILEQDKKLFSQLLQKYEYWFIGTLFIGAFLITVIAMFFINRLIKPIISLSKVADEITQKQDYSYHVTVSSNDEVGKLSESFNKMVVGMSETLTKLKEETKNREILIQEQSKNEMLKQLSHKLSKYLSPQIYESIFSGAQDVTLTSKRKKLTIFFSDIVNFTDTPETMESEDLSELLNEYLNDMTLIALKHGATVDKYIGDAIMLFFGDPKSNGIQKDALACVEMALEMQEHMDTLHVRWSNKDFTKPFKIRIGIHTGYCTVGNFGSENRLEYTIIGSSVNLASRIESTANPGEILISEETQLLVVDRFEFQKSKEIVPKGFTHPIFLYNVTKKEEKINNKLELKENGSFLSLNIVQIPENRKEELKSKLINIINSFS